MTRARFLLAGLLKLLVAAACLVGAIAAYRFLVHPLIASAFSLGEHASSTVRRVGIFGAVVLSYWAFVRYYERRPVRELSLRWRWILLAAAAGALSIGVTILALFASGHYRLVGYRGLTQATGVLGLIGVAAVIEEVAFRAILFRILEERLGTVVALGASALVFGAVHLANHGARSITLLSVTLAGLMWCGVFIVSRNLWVVAAHHAFWNATIFTIGLPLSGSEGWRTQAPLATVYRGSDLWTGAAFGPEDSLVNIVVSIAICAALWRLARRSSGRSPEGNEKGPPSTGRTAQSESPPIAT